MPTSPIEAQTSASLHQNCTKTSGDCDRVQFCQRVTVPLDVCARAAPTSAFALAWSHRDTMRTGFSLGLDPPSAVCAARIFHDLGMKAAGPGRPLPPKVPTSIAASIFCFADTYIVDEMIELIPFKRLPQDQAVEIFCHPNVTGRLKGQQLAELAKQFLARGTWPAPGNAIARLADVHQRSCAQALEPICAHLDALSKLVAYAFIALTLKKPLNKDALLACANLHHDEHNEEHRDRVQARCETIGRMLHAQQVRADDPALAGQLLTEACRGLIDRASRARRSLHLATVSVTGACLSPPDLDKAFKSIESDDFRLLPAAGILAGYVPNEGVTWYSTACQRWPYLGEAERRLAIDKYARSICPNIETLEELQDLVEAVVKYAATPRATANIFARVYTILPASLRQRLFACIPAPSVYWTVEDLVTANYLSNQNEEEEVETTMAAVWAAATPTQRASLSSPESLKTLLQSSNQEAFNWVIQKTRYSPEDLLSPLARARSLP